MYRSDLKKCLIVLLLSVSCILSATAQFSKKQAVFMMKVTNRAIPQDSSFRKEMLSSVSGRLAGIYPHQVQAEDLVLSQDQIELRLTGKIDTALVKRILNKPVGLNFYGGYKDAAGVTAQLKAKGAEKWITFLPAGVTSRTYLGSLDIKDTSAVRNITRAVTLSGPGRWYFRPMSENIVELYLLDVARPIINSDAVIHAEKYKGGFGGIEDHFKAVAIVLNKPGGIQFSEYTKTHLNEMLAIVSGDDLVLAAIINSEISGGMMLITSGYDDKSAELLLKKIGYPFPAKIQVTGCKSE